MDFNIIKFYGEDQTVFSLEEIKQNVELSNLKFQSWIDLQVTNRNFKKITEKLYAINNYNIAELCNKLSFPSYISLGYVLRKEGINYQYDTKVTAISESNKCLTIDGNSFEYREIDERILWSPQGVCYNNNMSIATKERAVLDMLYLNDNFYLDVPYFLDFNLIYKILPIYKSNRLEQQIKKLEERIQDELRTK